VGPRTAVETGRLWAAAHRKYRPFAVMVRVDPSEQAAMAVHMPWIAGMKMIGNQPTVYVCRGVACDAPTTDAAVLA
jgi:uncharacterized protein